MSKYRNVGPQRRDEIAPQRAWHDMRRPGQKLGEILRTPTAAIGLYSMLAGMGFIIPATADIALVVGFFCWLFIRKAQSEYTLPAKIPRHSGIIDPMEVNPAGKAGAAKGSFFLGNDRDTGEEVWLTNRDAGVHMLVLGTTGSGKALKMSEPVLTPGGFKPMRDIAVGDLVVHPSGRAIPVLGVFPQGRLSLMRLTFEDGRRIDVSPDHLWQVRRSDDGGRLGEPIVLDTKSLALHIKEGRGSFFIPFFEGEDPKSLRQLLEHGREDTSEEDVLRSRRSYVGSVTSPVCAAYVVDRARQGGAIATVRENTSDGVWDVRVTVPSRAREDGLRVDSVQMILDSAECQCIKVDSPDGLFVAGDYIVTHNTEMLLGICQNALNQGSGFMFVDGKAQDKIAFKIMDLVRARGRDDDYLCLNFMTGARDIIGPQPSKITNTMNPFSYGSAGMVSQIVVGLMSAGSGGDDMWKDRAISFVEGLSPPLTYLRDRYGLILDVNEYRKYFELDRIEELCWKGGEQYPGLDLVLDPLKNYLLNLPGYDRNKFGKRGGQGEDTRLQHGYITMQLVRAFTSLADTYGHIVRVPLGEVYFPDLVKNRRILIVMLPSLEKTPSETANIGKIIVTALRNIMAEGLGSVLEGDREALENEDGRALLPPYVVILDEYGYYAVKGFAVAFAQARSLGFVCVVGGQDLASFQRESKEEAVSICGNTRIKAFGSVEDPEQTMDFVVKTAGKTMVAKNTGFDADPGSVGTKYADNLNVHFESIDRINPSDIKEQTEGQFHFVWRSRVIRAQTYYVNPKRVKRVRLNHFVQVPPPDRLTLEELQNSSSGIGEKLSQSNLFEEIETVPVREIEAVSMSLRQARHLGPIEQGIVSVVASNHERERHIQSFKEAVRGELPEGEAPDLFRKLTGAFDAPERAQDRVPGRAAGGAHVADVDLDDDDRPVRAAGSSGSSGSSGSAGPAEALGIRPEDLLGMSPMGAESGIEPTEIDPFETMNVFVPPRREAAQNAGAPGKDARENQEDGAPLLDYNATLQGVESLERAMGATPEEAGAAAREVVRSIEDATRYPQSKPQAKSGEQVTNMLEDLLKALED